MTVSTKQKYRKFLSILIYSTRETAKEILKQYRDVFYFGTDVRVTPTHLWTNNVIKAGIGTADVDARSSRNGTEHEI